MFGSDILNVCIGMAFVFFLFSLLSSWIQEAFAALTRKRAKHLFTVISTLLNPTDTTDPAAPARTLTDKLLRDFYNHPVIKGLVKSGKEQEEPMKTLSHIPAATFSLVILDLLYKAGKEEETRNQAAAQTIDKGTFDLALIKKGLSSLPDGQVKKALQLLITAAETTEEDINKKINAIEKKIGAWFNSVMDRASEWYKRNIQLLAIIVGIGLAGAFNVDSIALVKSLWQETALREAVTGAAVAYVNKATADTSNQGTISYTEITDQINQLSIPIGWDAAQIKAAGELPDNGFYWWLVFKVLGILLTGLAVSQGSSFWYDVLKRVVNMRIGGAKSDEQKKKEDVTAVLPQANG